MPNDRFLRYVTCDVFTGVQFGGNPLAVVLDARGLTTEEMLAVTREFNYSETTFVLPPERGGAARVRIFTPGGEVPFAGHPTVGTAHVLVALGLVPAAVGTTTVVLEEQVGDVPVAVRIDGAPAPAPPFVGNTAAMVRDASAMPSAAFTGAFGGVEPAFAQLSVASLPEERPAPDAATLAEVLGLAREDVLDGAYAPRTASCGLPFVIVPLASHDAVRRARVRHEAWERALPPDAWSRELLVFAMGAPDAAPDEARPSVNDTPDLTAGGASHAAGADVHARVFVPGLSVPEDPATGSANAALGGYLAARTPRLDGTLRWSVAQGLEMGRPSRLEVEVDRRGGVTTAVRVGGRAVIVAEGTMRVRTAPRAPAGGEHRGDGTRRVT